MQRQNAGMKTLPINQWATDDRPRERLLAKGPEQLSDAELLAILLGHGAPGMSAVDLARALVEQFGSLRAILNAAHTDLMKIRGIGNAKASVLFAARECSSRYLRERLRPGVAIGSPADSRQFLLASLRDRPHEVFCCLFLDNRHRVLAFDELFRGTIDAATVYPREVVKQALARNAAAVILAHNHPSGNSRTQPIGPADYPPDQGRTRTGRHPFTGSFRHRRQHLCFAGQPGHALESACK